MEFMEIVMYQEGSKINDEVADEWEDELWKLLDKMIIRLRRFPFPGTITDQLSFINVRLSFVILICNCI